MGSEGQQLVLLKVRVAVICEIMAQLHMERSGWPPQGLLRPIRMMDRD